MQVRSEIDVKNLSSRRLWEILTGPGAAAYRHDRELLLSVRRELIAREHYGADSRWHWTGGGSSVAELMRAP